MFVESKIDFRLKSKFFSFQFLPKKLETISSVKVIKYRNQNLKTSYLIDIIHSLLLKYYFKKENIFHLSSIVLKDKYGDKYNYYIQYLIEYNYIKLFKNYQKGKNARIYKLDNDVINDHITRYKNKDNILLKKYKNNFSLIDYQDLYNNSIDFEVKNKLINDLFHVKIDFEKSIFFLDKQYYDNDSYNKNKYSIECINNNHIFYHFCNYGRLHTNFTILNSFIRKNFLLIDDEETIEMDISNSQPRFLLKIILDNDINIVDKNEFNFFKQLTINGLFYQYIIDNSSFKEKKEVKEMVYKVFFGRNYKNNFDDTFKSLFPTIYEFIRIYKKDMGDYKILAYQLQKAESNLIFNKIIKSIYELYPDIKIITVHDSIIYQKKYKDIIEPIFHDKLKDEFNI